MNRVEREAYNAGRQWVRDNKETLAPGQDLQSQAMDLAQGSGIDADWVYEGMTDEQDYMEGKR
jgi:hypothetical protein